MFSAGRMVNRIREPSRLVTCGARAGYKLVPPCSMNAKWNPAVRAIALSRSGKVDWVGSGLTTLPAVSSLLLVLAGCIRTFNLGTAFATTAFASKPGLVMLLYGDQKRVA